MKVGVFLVLFQNEPFEKALDMAKEAGAEAVEISSGGIPGKSHCDPAALLKDDSACDALKEAVAKRDLVISAFSCHGNPVHPDPSVAHSDHEDFRASVLLAEKMGVRNVITFSGCPGDAENARYPNWVTCPWPPDFLEILKWQWEEKLIPYWKENPRFAADHGVRVCLEMHPGFAVYNPETMLRLREASGEALGCNFDPSHLFWQGIDPIQALRVLKESLFHVHAKDTKIDPINSPVNGNLDTKPYTEELARSWLFRTVGYGHGESFWRDLVSNLRLIGYDDVLSIEHEDSLMSGGEGFNKAIALLKQVCIKEGVGAAWWV